MKIGIIGSGVVGKTLAAGFRKHGHEVEIGTREPDKLQEWASRDSGPRVGWNADAAKFADLVVLAVAGSAAMEAAQLAGAENLAGKTVIDACNPIGGGPPVNRGASFLTHTHGSLM